MGFLLDVVVTQADVSDPAGAKMVFIRRTACCKKLRLVWGDGTSRGKLLDWVQRQFQFRIQPILRMDLERKAKVVQDYEALFDSLEQENAPRDDRFRRTHLFILLLAEQFERARQIAERYISEVAQRHLTTKDTLYDFWYNLACAQARVGEQGKCHSSLLEATKYKSLDGNYLMQDVDLESLREKEWFKALAEQYPIRKSNRNIQFKLPSAVVSNVIQDGDESTLEIEWNGGVSNLEIVKPEDARRDGEH